MYLIRLCRNELIHTTGYIAELSTDRIRWNEPQAEFIAN
jgi:hypothetical protein